MAALGWRGAEGRALCGHGVEPEPVYDCISNENMGINA